MLTRRQTMDSIDREAGDDRSATRDRSNSVGSPTNSRSRVLQNIRNCVLALSLILTACGTTRRFVEQPSLAVDEPQEGIRQAIADLYGETTPYTIQLCEADLSSKECKSGSKGITATGVGGLLLPLTLHVRDVVVRQQSQSIEGLSFDASLDATVDGVSPLCGTVHGKIVSRDNNTASIELRNFYCNWVVVGNVIVNADLSIDTIHVKDKMFTGFYKVTFHGTGNAGGSGYYKAVITPKGA